MIFAITGQVKETVKQDSEVSLIVFIPKKFRETDILRAYLHSNPEEYLKIE